MSPGGIVSWQKLADDILGLRVLMWSIGNPGSKTRLTNEGNQIHEFERERTAYKVKCRQTILGNQKETVPGERADLVKFSVVTARHIDRLWYHEGKRHIQQGVSKLALLVKCAATETSVGGSQSWWQMQKSR